jgi:26S proteasome regulatory subunit N8
MLAIYLASVIRAVVALHNLIDNRIVNKEKERASDEVAANKDKEGAAKKDEGKENKEQGKGAAQK